MHINAETNPAKAALNLVNGQRHEIVVHGNPTDVSERLAQLGLTLASPESKSQTTFPETDLEFCAFLGLPSSAAPHIHLIYARPGDSDSIGASIDAEAALLGGFDHFRIPTGKNATVCLDTPFVSPLITDLPTLRRMVQYLNPDGSIMPWVRADTTWGDETDILVHPHRNAPVTIYGGQFHDQRVQCDTQTGNFDVLFERQGGAYLPLTPTRFGFGSTTGVPNPAVRR